MKKDYSLRQRCLPKQVMLLRSEVASSDVTPYDVVIKTPTKQKLCGCFFGFIY